MFSGQKHIKNEYKRFNNPIVDDEFENKYSGPADGYTFPTPKQVEHYKNIKALLENFQITPLEVYAGVRGGLDTFIVTFSNPNIIWRKYESRTPGGYQNYIWIKDHAYSIHIFNDYTVNHVQTILKDRNIIDQ